MQSVPVLASAIVPEVDPESRPNALGCPEPSDNRETVSTRPPPHPLSALRDLFRSLGVNDETEGERETLDDGYHLEILQTGLERLAVWVTAGGRGSNDCIARRARFLFFVTDFDSRDKS
ncbi:MAG: hypothetical protein DVB32_08720 [Verrucomicrobia bacterium]|nr:MAG: hypothetical protein DVB32_08720 [Verrucomicrobiota bacterium]